MTGEINLFIIICAFTLYEGKKSSAFVTRAAGNIKENFQMLKVTFKHINFSRQSQNN